MAEDPQEYPEGGGEGISHRVIAEDTGRMEIDFNHPETVTKLVGESGVKAMDELGINPDQRKRFLAGMSTWYLQTLEVQTGQTPNLLIMGDVDDSQVKRNFSALGIDLNNAKKLQQARGLIITLILRLSSMLPGGTPIVNLQAGTRAELLPESVNDDETNSRD